MCVVGAYVCVWVHMPVVAEGVVSHPLSTLPFSSNVGLLLESEARLAGSKA